MLWIDDHKGVWRAAVLVLLVVAVVGPWTFDRIYMPAEYPCRAPSVRLEGEFCGIPLAGVWVFSQVVAAFMNLLVGLFTGATAFTDLVGDLPLFLFFGLIQLMVVLPFLSTLLLILRDGRRSGQAFHLALWGLAAGACLLLGISSFSQMHRTLWGIWLYTGLAASALILEGLTLAVGRRAG